MRHPCGLFPDQVQLIQKYPDEKLAVLAKNQLEEMENQKYPPIEKTVEDKPVSAFTLSNHANPVNPVTTLQYTLPEDGHVTLTIYDMRGRRVAALVNQEQQAGRYTVNWNCQTQAGASVSSGLYF